MAGADGASVQPRWRGLVTCDREGQQHRDAHLAALQPIGLIEHEDNRIPTREEVGCEAFDEG